MKDEKSIGAFETRVIQYSKIVIGICGLIMFGVYLYKL